ncbi:helix-turn-helix transcriptional regulator [Tessaracoccus sp. SD287]|uniref:helix-turn-helix domain-containing protein n=1 Tax=Tessaracoccus sp. SD287 TaxID=2782008 RepID=UPI001A9722CE
MVGIILRCRRTADLSQRELAALLGVSPSTVARWETGERMPNADTLAAIADLAGYRMGLIDHRGEPVTPAPRETLRDRRGRRIPPHLDVVLQEDTVWQADPEVPGGWRSVPHTIHTPRRWRRDLHRDDVAHTAVTRVSGCVPFHTNHDGSRRQCHDIPTPQDHADWSAIVATIHQTRRQQRQAERATWPRVPAPEPCFCDVDCHEGPGCSLGCPCHCEPAVSY